MILKKMNGCITPFQALLSGCSAGGLAAILHCDRFSDLLPSSANVKCLSDAGYFIDGWVLNFWCSIGYV